MSTAQWVTSPDLGSFVESYNFNLHPLTIQFESDPNAAVSFLNGALPSGLSYSRVGNTLVLSGESTGVNSSVTSFFTFRISDPDGTIDDRTYNLTVTPIVITPNWTGQKSFLGYMTINTTANFTVLATISNNAPISYSLIPTAPYTNIPQGMNINPVTGVITYTNTVLSPIPADFEQTYSATVVATSGTVSDNLPITIIVLGLDHSPGWLTTAGSLGNYLIDQWVEIVFATYDPNGNEVTYSLSNVPQGFPYTLTPTGFLYGESPITAIETVWSFTVNATSVTGTSSETFYITVASGPSEELVFNSPGELGTWSDGQYIVIDVRATSTRSALLIYEFIGGTLPPDLRLNSYQGYLVGFLEFHPQTRDYYFEIQVTDGTLKATQQFHMSVDRDRKDRYLDVRIPVHGQLKQALTDTRAQMFKSPVSILDYNVKPFIPIAFMNLVSGLGFQGDNVTAVMQQIASEAHSLDLLIGQTANVSTSNSIVYYRDVIDFQANASPVTTRLVGNISIGSTAVSYNPISLNNMRAALIEDFGFANDGQGSGASFLTTIDQYTTGVANVLVLNSGSGYYSAPSLIIQGSGNGAVLTANLTVQSVTVTSPGYGWVQNEIFNVIVSGTQFVQLQVSDIDSNGGLQTITVLNGNNFNQFPQGNKVVMNGNGAIATISFNLGVKSVDIVSSGTGYSPLYQQNVIIQGSEILPSWQQSWSPVLYLGTIDPKYANDVIASTTVAVENVLSNIVWTAQWIELVAQGRSWTGNTFFDQQDCSFDGDQTRFIEWIEPRDTIFDNQGNTTFDINSTVFDNNYGLGDFAYDVWTNNVWPPNTNIFDVYAGLITDVDADVYSTTSVKRIYRLLSQQVGSYNQTI